MSTHTESGTWKLRHRVRVPGGEVATDVFGQGPPVILVHGTPASSFLWREVAPILAREHSVHVWDLLGFGDSRPARGVVPSIDLQARTLAELVRHWDLGAPALVGHDIGGATVLRAHLVHGVPVRRLALLDAAVISPWLTPFTHHMRTHADVYRTMPAQVFADIIRPRLRTATHRPMPEAVASAYLAPWDGAAGQQRWIDQVAAVSDDDTRDIEARLHEITVPTHVLWGENDQWLPPATAARLAAAIPGARRTMISGAGHFLPEDSPYDTAEVLLRFLG
ncbi:alpha/beta fold hydrolase [Nonomuraea diastatica]|uniref:Alpha/beta hydrolase n=1 Tax=Nonomuraea diastatica TaxID=1848329 RepID=A0A4V2YD94_9ACTN|nr:alpha/beta hydrolase [Nonomuraea diastatica]TDD14546.1 alpha/beta hydrolase [Nonomuraea diastatica]